MTNYARRGNNKDLRSRELLEADDYVVGSRRHIPGPGDLLAYKWHRGGSDPLLVEVKACAEGALWSNFRRAHRKEMIEYANEHGLIPVIHWWKPGARAPRVIYSWDWPVF